MLWSYFVKHPVDCVDTFQWDLSHFATDLPFILMLFTKSHVPLVTRCLT